MLKSSPFAPRTFLRKRLLWSNFIYGDFSNRNIGPWKIRVVLAPRSPPLFCCWQQTRFTVVCNLVFRAFLFRPTNELFHQRLFDRCLYFTGFLIGYFHLKLLDYFFLRFLCELFATSKYFLAKFLHCVSQHNSLRCFLRVFVLHLSLLKLHFFWFGKSSNPNPVRGQPASLEECAMWVQPAAEAAANKVQQLPLRPLEKPFSFWRIWLYPMTWA